MKEALAAALEASLHGEVPIGAVVVQGDDVIVAERNRIRELHDPTAHAEVLAIRAAARLLGNERLEGCRLYVTLEPCPMCSGAIVLARITDLVFGAFDPKAGAAITHFGVVNSSVLNHRVEVLGGVMASESLDLLQSFFRARRGDGEGLINPMQL